MVITGGSDAKRKLEWTDVIGVFLNNCWDYQVWVLFSFISPFFFFSPPIACSQLAWRHTKLFLLHFDSRSLLNAKIVTLPKLWKINLQPDHIRRETPPCPRSLIWSKFKKETAEHQCRCFKKEMVEHQSWGGVFSEIQGLTKTHSWEAPWMENSYPDLV